MAKFKKLRINQEIRVPEVRLIDADKNMLGVVKTSEALSKAAAADLDLVEVSPQDSPPVCKIMAYGTYLYNQKKAAKKQKAASSSNKANVVKMVRISPRIGDHDLEVRSKQIHKFLEKRHRVKIVMMFRGRENAYQDLGMEKLKSFLATFEEVAEYDEPKKQGNQLFSLISPKK